MAANANSRRPGYSKTNTAYITTKKSRLGNNLRNYWKNYYKVIVKFFIFNIWEMFFMPKNDCLIYLYAKNIIYYENSVMVFSVKKKFIIYIGNKFGYILLLYIYR
jgi:hypothetical protein